MKRILIFSFLSVLFTACSKDKVETKPHVSLKSLSMDVVPPTASGIRVTLEFTDQEGDLDSLFVVRQRLNARGPAYRILPYGIPEFNGQSKGELILSMGYQDGLVLNLNALRIPGSDPPEYESDTLQLKFYVKDKAGNVSDSTSPRQVIVVR